MTSVFQSVCVDSLFTLILINIHLLDVLCNTSPVLTLCYVCILKPCIYILPPSQSLDQISLWYRRPAEALGNRPGNADHIFQFWGYTSCMQTIWPAWVTAGLLPGYCWVTAGLLLSNCWDTAGLLLSYCWVTAGILLSYCWDTAGLLLGYRKRKRERKRMKWVREQLRGNVAAHLT